MRKIIQVQDVQPSHQYGGYIVALCDDGTIWHYSEGAWSLHVEQIPQDDLFTGRGANETN